MSFLHLLFSDQTQIFKHNKGASNTSSMATQKNSQVPSEKRSTKRVVASTILGGLAFYILVIPVFDFGFFTGVGFVISCARAFWKGAVSRKPRIIIYIAVTYIITNIAFRILFPLAFLDVIKGSFLTALMVIGIYLLVWIEMRRLRRY
jgi:hypothetical protein